MIEEKPPFELAGWITIIGIDRSGKRFILADRKNQIQSNAKNILVHALAEGTFLVDQIKVYKAGAPLATTPPLTWSFPPGNDKVLFNGRFDEASFNDTFDEIRLDSSTGGNFSKITGLSVTKNNTLQLEVQWKITLNNL